MGKNKLVPINNVSFTSKEYEEFCRIYNTAENNPWMHYSTRSTTEFEAIFKKLASHSQLFVYKNDEGKIVGICRAAVDKEGPYQHIARIASIAIAPEEHNKHYGTSLLNDLEQYIIENFEKVKLLALTYEADNAVAVEHEFYIKLGYKIGGIFSDWFQPSLLEYHNEHPWYSAEYFASKQIPQRLKNINYHKTAEPDTARRVFKKLDLKNVYELSKSNKSFTLKKAGKIVATCNIDEQPEGLEHITTLENPEIKDNDLDNSTALFSLITDYYLTENIGVKRLEIHIPANNKIAIKGLETSNFQYTDTQDCHFYDEQNDQYYDEHLFECCLFNLEDAFKCIEKREDARNNISENHFNLILGYGMFVNLTNILKQLKNELEIDPSFTAENIAYRIIRLICTQDCLSLETRLSEIKALHKDFKITFTAYESLENLYKYLKHFLSHEIDPEYHPAPIGKSQSSLENPQPQSLFFTKSPKKLNNSTTSIIKTKQQETKPTTQEKPKKSVAPKTDPTPRRQRSHENLIP